MVKSTRGGIGVLLIGILIGTIIGVALASSLIGLGWNLDPLAYFRSLGSEQSVQAIFGKQEGTSDTGEGSQREDIEWQAGEDSLRLSVNRIAEGGDNTGKAHPQLSAENEHAGINVAQDRLIAARQVTIEGFVDEDAGLDSLLLDESGSLPDRGSGKVEFWESPINYRGYKWANNKLVLFGFDSKQSLRLILLEGMHYLEHGGTYYILQESVHFRSVSEVKDAALTQKLDAI